MIVRLHPAARDDIREATEWYARRNTSVASRFIAAVESAIIEISEFPQGPPRSETWSGVENIRRVRLQRFPYVIVFEVRSGEIVIWCVSHTQAGSQITGEPAVWRNPSDAGRLG